MSPFSISPSDHGCSSRSRLVNLIQTNDWLLSADACQRILGTGNHDGCLRLNIYTCNCGPECKCNSVSTKPGKCACGQPMKWGHVVKIEGNEALLCTCKEGCKCSGLEPKDPTKRACGSSVKRVSLKGTGIYFCNCGGSCMCNTVSDSPGNCKCGMELKKVD